MDNSGPGHGGRPAPPPTPLGEGMTSTAALPDLRSVVAARRRIEPHVVRSRVVRSEALSAIADADVFLKLETDQPTGSFKVRGACNAMLAMLEVGPVAGVTTASTGNHARAVAYMGRRLQLGTRAFVSRTVSDQRVQALQDMGAAADRSSTDQTAAIRAAEEFAVAHGYGFIPPFDHPDVISGQGTIGLELCEDLDQFDAVVVPVSGGGLVSGIGLAVKALRPATKIIGVCAELAPAMQKSLSAGRPVAVPEAQTVAESLMGDLGSHNRFTFRIAQRVIDQIVTVPDADIVTAMTGLRDDDGVAVEGAAAAGAAYLRNHGSQWLGARIALLVTGNAGAKPI
jgi:threonine dehydratase